MKVLGVSPGSLEESSVAGMRAELWNESQDFCGETSNLKIYHFRKRKNTTFCQHVVPWLLQFDEQLYVEASEQVVVFEV